MDNVPPLLQEYIYLPVFSGTKVPTLMVGNILWMKSSQKLQAEEEAHVPMHVSVCMCVQMAGPGNMQKKQSQKLRKSQVNPEDLPETTEPGSEEYVVLLQ